MAIFARPVDSAVLSRKSVNVQGRLLCHVECMLSSIFCQREAVAQAFL